MKALGNPRITMKMWKKWYFVFNHRHRTTCEALANFKRCDKKKARRESRAEAQVQLADMQNLQALTIDELRDLAASYTDALPTALLYELHYRLWDWLAHNPDQYKYDWPNWDGEYRMFGGHFINAGCFLCRATLQRATKTELMHCHECPMSKLSRQYDNSTCWAYSQWHGAIVDNDYSDASMWARRIRNCVRRG